MTDPQLRVFNEKVWPKVASTLKSYASLYGNTWGDAVTAGFDGVREAARCALDIRDVFLKGDWAFEGLPTDLTIRIALHFAEAEVIIDPVQRRLRISGTEVNYAARLEPVTPAGAVYASEAFLSVHRRIRDSKIEYDDIGEIELPKGAGTERACHVRWKTDRPINVKLSPKVPNAITVPVPPVTNIDAPAPRSEPPPERLVLREQLRDPALGLTWEQIERHCKESLLIAGWSCRGVVSPSMRELFLQLVSSERKVQILSYDPAIVESCSLDLGPVCNVGPEYVHFDVSKGLNDFRDLLGYVKDRAGQGASKCIEIRTTSWFMAWSAVAVDRSTNNGLLQIEFYHYNNPYRAVNHLNKRLELVLTPRSPFYLGFKSSIDSMWDSANIVIPTPPLRPH